MDLEQRLFDCLVAMQMLSNGATQRFDGDRTTGTRERSLFPAGESKPEYLAFQVRFARAHSFESRLQIVEEAEATLSQWRRTKPPTEPEWGSYWWKKHIANSDLTGGELARRFGVSRQTVQNYRRKYRDKDAA